VAGGDEPVDEEVAHEAGAAKDEDAHRGQGTPTGRRDKTPKRGGERGGGGASGARAAFVVGTGACRSTISSGRRPRSGR
jgi:hypothetical protein